MKYWGKKSKFSFVAFLTILVAIVLLCVPMANIEASAYQNWTGVWATDYGKMKLEQQGKYVSGTYSLDNESMGYINGSIEDEWGFTLSGTWNNGDTTGTFTFRMADMDDSFQGWWNSDNNTWNGRRISVEREQQMDIVNNSPYHITALFICPAGSEDWQEVLCGMELGSGKQKKVIFNLDDREHKWDIKIVDSSGNFTVFQRQRIKRDFTSIDYYYKGGTGYIRFAVG